MSGTTALGFPYPTDPDPMCGPAGLPITNAVRLLADSVQAWLTANIDPVLASPRIASGPARARVSRTGPFNLSGVAVAMVFDTVEYNVATPTDLAVSNQGVIVAAGVWQVTVEVSGPGSTDTLGIYMGFGSVMANESARMPAGAAAYGDGQAIGMLVRTPEPLAIAPFFTPQYTTGPAVITYAAVSAVQISDYV